MGTFPATAIYAEKLVDLVQEALEKAQGEGGNPIQVAEKKLRAMETTRMTRDQVLAAVERRRQARRSTKAVDDDSRPPDEGDDGAAAAQEAPSPGPRAPGARPSLQPPGLYESPALFPGRKKSHFLLPMSARVSSMGPPADMEGASSAGVHPLSQKMRVSMAIPGEYPPGSI